MHFASVFEKISRIIPEESALVCEDKVVTWREYEDQAAKLANYLEKKGLSFDSKVGLYLHNSNEYLVAQFAAFKNECVPINVNYRYQEDELIYLLDNSDAEAIFYQACYANRIKAIKNKLNIQEVAVNYRKRIGKSKVSGTFKGTVLAGYKIISTIIKYI